MSESTKNTLSQFLQSGIDSLENTWSNPWQQRIDTIITRWNRENPKLKIYKYQPGINDNVPAWEKWRNIYNTHNQQDFSEKFWVTFPAWLAVKHPWKNRKNNIWWGDNLIAVPQTDVPRTQETVNNVAGEEQGKATVDPMQYHQKMAELVSTYVPILHTILKESLIEYKKGKVVTWYPENFRFNIAELEISIPTLRIIHIDVWIPSEEQKWFWRALITKNGIKTLQKEVQKNKGYTFKYDEKKRLIRIETGTFIVITIQIPNEEKLKPTYQKVTEMNQETETHQIESLKWVFSLELSRYLEWFYNTHHSTSSIVRDRFINPGSIVYRILEATDEKENKRISGSISGHHSWLQSAYQALQNVENLKHYFEGVKNGTGIHLVIDRGSRESVKFVYENPTIPWIELEFRPY